MCGQACLSKSFEMNKPQTYRGGVLCWMTVDNGLVFVVAQLRKMIYIYIYGGIKSSIWWDMYACYKSGLYILTTVRWSFWMHHSKNKHIIDVTFKRKCALPLIHVLFTNGHSMWTTPTTKSNFFFLVYFNQRLEVTYSNFERLQVENMWRPKCPTNTSWMKSLRGVLYGRLW